MTARKSAIAVADAIRTGAASATEVLNGCLARIDRHNADINAVVTLDRERAIESARRLDSEGLADATLPLLGVPISIKDTFETAGLRTTSSHPPLANHVPMRDATVVARLKAAGAIVIGKTNLSQLAGDPQCWSPIFGRTNNPWNPELTSGGSSGGGAAAVATGFSFLDPGSDIGGSIRIPAAYCGVAGLKATENRIPRTGVIPHLPNGQRSVRHLLSFGLLARGVADLEVGLQVLSGPDGIDSEVPPLPIRDLSVAKSRRLRIAWWDDFCGLPLCPRTRTALAGAVDKLRQEGHTVERRCPEGFDFDRAWYAYGIIAGAEIGLGMPIGERTVLGQAGRFLPPSQPIARHFTAGLRFDWKRYNDALNVREQLLGQLERFLGDWDAWLCPVAPTVAYPHCRLTPFRKPPTLTVNDRPLPYLEATISMTTPFSLTGSPVVALPAGVVDGLPVGLQWVGRRWHDEELLACCAQAEADIGGHVAPPGYD